MGAAVIVLQNKLETLENHEHVAGKNVGVPAGRLKRPEVASSPLDFFRNVLSAILARHRPTAVFWYLHVFIWEACGSAIG